MKHQPDCRLYKAMTCAVGIACDHGYDVCPTCDPCNCTTEGKMDNFDHWMNKLADDTAEKLEKKARKDDGVKAGEMQVFTTGKNTGDQSVYLTKNDEFNLVGYWIPTPELRFMRETSKYGGTAYVGAPRLQQKWVQQYTGKTKWQDVPIETVRRSQDRQSPVD